MKTSALLLVIFFIGLNASFGQVKLGIKGGLNASGLSQENNKIIPDILGYHAGILIKGGVTSLSVQAELLYNTKGGQGEFHNYQLDYIDVPVLAVIRVFKIINVQLGPYASYLTRARVIDRLANGGTTVLTEYNRNSFYAVDYGLSAGLSVESSRTGLGIRYNQGLSEVARDQRLHGKLFNLKDARNSLWQIYLVYYIF